MNSTQGFAKENVWPLPPFDWWHEVWSFREYGFPLVAPDGPLLSTFALCPTSSNYLLPHGSTQNKRQAHKTFIQCLLQKRAYTHQTNIRDS